MNIKYGLKEFEEEFGPFTFGGFLRSYRIGEELNQAQMAKLLKISKQSLNDLEAGRTIPSISRASKIAKRLRLPDAVLIETALNDQLRKVHPELTLKIGVRGKKKAS